MMKVRYLLLALCFVCVATICHAEEEKEPKSREHYQQEGVTIVVPNHWKPYAFVNQTGKHEGYLLDVWRKWSESSGITVHFLYRDWPDTLEAMKNGEADIHSGLFYSDERAEYMDYGDAVHTDSAVLAIRNDATVDCSNAMSDGAVAVVKSGYPEEFVTRHYPETVRVPFGNTREAVVGFLEGKADGIVISFPSLAMLAKEVGMADKYSVCRTMYYRDTHAGIQKGETLLLELVNEGLANISEESLRTIEGRWFVTAEEKPKMRWQMAIFPAAIALGFVVLAVVLWIRRRG